MNLPAIILAGGFGTRLQSVVKDVPKPMAEINGIPFLKYLFQYLKQQNIEDVILSVGYKHDVIVDYFGKEFDGIKINYVIEDKPLGTGGAIRKAFEIAGDEAFVLNGDTFFDVNLFELFQFYNWNRADLALALKPMSKFDRYGTVTTDQDGRILSFNEKKYCEDGLINGGVYVMSSDVFYMKDLPEVFSFEKEILEGLKDEARLFGLITEPYFIDIGIPEDYQKAQHDFKSYFNTKG